MRLTVKQLTAVLKAGLLVTNADGETKKEEMEIVVRELESFVGESVIDLKDMVKAAKKYIEKGVKNVLVSLGADGAVLTDGTESYYCKSASVAVNSTVGAGDCMVAATCVGLLNGVPMHELLKMSVAAGTAAVTTSGTNLFYYDKYKEIYTKIYSQKI